MMDVRTNGKQRLLEEAFATYNWLGAVKEEWKAVVQAVGARGAKLCGEQCKTCREWMLRQQCVEAVTLIANLLWALRRRSTIFDEVQSCTTEQIVDVLVSRIRKETGEEIQLVPQDRISDRIAEQGVDVAAPEIREQDVEVVKRIAQELERFGKRR